MTTFVQKRAKEKNLRTVDGRSARVVEVSTADVRDGKRKDPQHCAFARACRRVDPDVKAAYFFRTSAWLEYDDKMVRYLLPMSVQKEIVSFDRAKVTAPGTYQLSPPRGENRLGAKRVLAKQRTKRRSGKRGNGPKKPRHSTALIRTLREPR